MGIKTLLFTTLLQKFFVTEQYIPIRPLVHLRCNVCEPDPNRCCIGTIILSNFILTSAFCAKSCQKVVWGNKTIPVIESFVHPHYKNYIKGKSLVASYDVGLIYIRVPFRNKEFHQKIVAEDTISVIGLKASYPVLTNMKPRLQITVIQYCDRNGSFRRYHICAGNEVFEPSVAVTYAIKPTANIITKYSVPPSTKQKTATLSKNLPLEKNKQALPTTLTFQSTVDDVTIGRVAVDPMEWFNSIRYKLMEKPPIFILCTKVQTTQRIPITEFMDLT